MEQDAVASVELCIAPNKLPFDPIASITGATGDAGQSFFDRRCLQIRASIYRD